ncbi:MAG: response regulator [Bacteroidetes bacterium]|nr:response regulator [Bacteroidota bacterium]MBL6942933.1 response regulator [Bacteroidales bacterium]
MVYKGSENSDNRYSAIFENAYDCIMLLKNNIIVDVNSKGYEMFGFNRDEMLGKSTDELSPTPDKIKDPQVGNQKGYLTKALDGEPQRFEWIHQKNDGSLFYSEISLSRLEGSDNYNILAIIRDISLRKEYERRLIEASEKAEEANRLKTNSLASMSHELRTPLNSIIGFSDLLLDEDTTEDEKEMFSKLIQSAGRSLMQLIGDIIDISKIEAGQVTIKKALFNVNSFLQDVLITFKQEKNNRNKSNIELKLILSDQASDLKIETDQHRLQQVFNNLLTNSLKFIDEGYIEFGYSSVTPENIQFYVKDTGVGIDNQKRDKIFEQYGQDKDIYNRNKEGTGLGLAISKSFVELLGGTIWVDSELDSGSTFYFTIPFEKNSGLTDKYLNKSLNVDSVNWSNRAILIVDDVKQNYVFLKGLLNHTRATILRAQNGKEAVEICKNNKSVDIVLMDIRMPVMDGFEASKLIRKDNPDICIIAQTAFASPEDKIKCVICGCNEYLKKPINHKELFSIITRHLR